MSRRDAALRWTAEALAELRARLEPWARTETEQNGCFSITSASAVLLNGSRNPEPVSRIVRELKAEGLIESYGRRGFRWLGATPGRVRRASHPYRWMPERLSALEADLVAFAERRTRADGHFTRDNAAFALTVPRGVLKPLLRRLASRGRLERLPGAFGYRAVGVGGPEVIAGPRGPSVWTADAMSELRHRVEAYARNATATIGGFTITAATMDLVGKRNAQPVSTIIRAMEEEGLVAYLTQERRWVSLGVDRPAPKNHSEPVVWTDEKVSELTQRVSTYAEEQSARHGRFTIAGAVEALEMGYKDPVSRVVHNLAESGKVVDLGSRLGWYWKGAMRQRVTLSNVLACCADHTEPRKPNSSKAKRRGRGRKGLDKDRNVSTLTPGLLEDVRWVATTIAEHAGDGSPGQVDNVWFAWDPAADGGVGNWTILEHLRRWLKDAKPNSRAKQVRAAELMCDLAATHGLLDRSPPAALPAPSAYAGELHAQLVSIESRIMISEPQANLATVKLGLKVLGRYLTGMHMHRWDLDALLTAREQITRDYRTWQEAEDTGSLVRKGLSKQHRNAARYVWRRLPELEKLRPWAKARDTRIGLIPNHAITRLLESLKKSPDPARWDFSGFVTEDGRYMRRLVEGRFGLRRWVTWVWLDPSQLERLNLPPRAWPRPNESQAGKMRRAERRRQQLFRCRATTLKSRLGRISLLAGWLKRHGFDPRVHDLRYILNEDRYVLYEEWREQNPTQPFNDPEAEAARKVKGLDQLALDMSRIASPFCEAVALRRGLLPVADRMHAVAKGLKSRGYERKPIENEVKIIREIYTAWSVGRRDGYLRLTDLVELILKDAEKSQGLTLEQAVASLRDGALTPSYTWALRIRDAVLIHCLRKVPLRALTLTLFEMNEWRNHSVDGTPASRLRKWEGAIQWVIAESKMKTHLRDFAPVFIHEQDVGDAEAENDAFRLLLEAYFINGGARHILLTAEDGEAPLTSRYVFPTPVRYGKAKQRETRSASPWRAPSVSAWFRRLVRRYASDLGLDWYRLRKMHGATGIHVIRLLFGSYWVGQGASELASLLLGHTDPGFTIRLYSGRDESNARLVLGAEVRSRRKEADLAAIEVLHRQLSTEREARLAAERRNADLATQVAELSRNVLELIRSHATERSAHTT